MLDVMRGYVNICSKLTFRTSMTAARADTLSRGDALDTSPTAFTTNCKQADTLLISVDSFSIGMTRRSSSLLASSTTLRHRDNMDNRVTPAEHATSGSH
jgi:hypothetical protein